MDAEIKCSLIFKSLYVKYRFMTYWQDGTMVQSGFPGTNNATLKTALKTIRLIGISDEFYSEQKKSLDK